MAEQGEKPARLGKVVQQASVVFADAEITAVLAEDGYVYAALPHLCRALGLDTESQHERIEEQSALAKGLWQFPVVQGRGRQLGTTWCLRADLVPYWLALVPTKRMKSEKKARIDFYQDQVADVLGRLFGAMPTQAPTTEVLLASQNPVFAEGLAVARMALDQAQQALGRAEATSQDVKALKSAYDARITALEARLLPRSQLTEEQAEYISDLVKQAAIELANKLGGGNFFGTVYGQLYRAFNVTSYKLLTQAQYPKAVAWLEKLKKSYES
jgi:antirepressor protein/ORF6C domain-containing protein